MRGKCPSARGVEMRQNGHRTLDGVDKVFVEHNGGISIIAKT